MIPLGVMMKTFQTSEPGIRFGLITKLKKAKKSGFNRLKELLLPEKVLEQVKLSLCAKLPVAKLGLSGFFR